MLQSWTFLKILLIEKQNSCGTVLKLLSFIFMSEYVKFYFKKQQMALHNDYSVYHDKIVAKLL